MPHRSHLAGSSVINLFYRVGLCKRMCWALSSLISLTVSNH